MVTFMKKSAWFKEEPEPVTFEQAVKDFKEFEATYEAILVTLMIVMLVVVLVVSVFG